MKRFLLCATLLAVAACLPACNKKEAQPVAVSGGVAAEQKPAPDITVKTLKGEPLKLSSLKGTVVILNFWATWCPPCREEIPSMIRLNNAMAGKPFKMLAVSIDEGGAPDVEAFLAKSSQQALPAYLDSDSQAVKMYGITGVPETFIIDKNGVVIKKVIGPMAWDSAEVVAFLQNLMK